MTAFSPRYSAEQLQRGRTVPAIQSRLSPQNLALVHADAELRAWRAFAARVTAMADAAEKLDRPAARFTGYANAAVKKLGAVETVGNVGERNG